MKCDPAIFALTESFIHRVNGRMKLATSLSFEKMKEIITGVKNTVMMAFHQKLIFDHIKFSPLDVSPWMILEPKTSVGIAVIEELKLCRLLDSQSSLLG